MKEYINYHKHDDDTNFVVLDVVVKTEDYLKRAAELGHTSYFTTNHGSMGDIYKAKTLCGKYGIKCYAGLEGYIVEDNSSDDSSNYHIVIIPKTNVARKKLNVVSSHAHEFGYYNGRPRLDLGQVLTLDPDLYFITTACFGGVLKDPLGVENIFYPLMSHFGKNLMIEVQPHMDPNQIEYNKKCIKIANQYGLDLIAANDSHYIYPEQGQERTLFLKGKRSWAPEEEGFILDYPDYDTFVQRFVDQGIFTKEQAEEMIDRTNIFAECEEIEIDMSIKMPTAYPELNNEQKIALLKQKANEGFKKRVKHLKTKEERQKRIDGLKYEMEIVEQTTEEVLSADYFLFNEKVVDIAVNKYGGILTRAGRGSGGCFYLNNVLGITEIDRFASKLPFYPERFASVARLLENKSMPDIDFNVAEQEPFVQASKDLVGEYGVYPMFTFKQQGKKDAIKNVCREKEIAPNIALTISNDIESYENDPMYKDIIKIAKGQADTVVSVSEHPCAYVIMNADIREEIGLIRCGKVLCAIITSAEADEYKYLKDDFLIVEVWKIISKTFKLIEKPILPLHELINNLDLSVWKLYDDGITCTLNQIDGEWATSLVREYKPRTVEELAMFIAAIRPAFESSRKEFLKRKKHTSGVPAFDNIFEETDGYIVFQENLMKYFEVLGVTPAESIGLIKKISKKKIKPEDFIVLTDRLKSGWINLTGSDSHFQETWDSLQSALGYGFNVPHGYAYAIDSLYCAYLKANYPIEYYTVCFETYAKSIEKVKRLKHELRYFGLSLEPVNFLKSKHQFAFDKEKGVIYRGTNSLKSFDKCVIENITELQKDPPNDFVDFLIRATEIKMTYLQLSRLITLGFFDSYGRKEKLHYLMSLYIWLKDKVQLNKDVLKEKIPYIQDFGKYAESETAKQYKGFDVEKLLRDLNAMEIAVAPIPEKIEKVTQVLHTGECEPSPTCAGLLVVLDKDKYDKKKFKCYSVKRGEPVDIVISKEMLTKNPIEKNDIITVLSASQQEDWKGGVYYRLYKYIKEKQKDIEKNLK